MSSTLTTPRPPASHPGEPAWEVAQLFPRQGCWTESAYLSLSSNHLVELVDGCLEVLPMPTAWHQMIVTFFFQALHHFVTERGLGQVFFAPLPVQLAPGRYREPDVFFIRPHRLRDTHSYPEGADLVMEVVSEGKEARERDLETKVAEYAAAGVAEYWIVDLEKRRIMLYVLAGNEYRLQGEYAPGTTVESVLLPGFSIAVTAAFAAGESAS